LYVYNDECTNVILFANIRQHSIGLEQNIAVVFDNRRFQPLVKLTDRACLHSFTGKLTCT